MLVILLGDGLLETMGSKSRWEKKSRSWGERLGFSRSMTSAMRTWMSFLGGPLKSFARTSSQFFSLTSPWPSSSGRGMDIANFKSNEITIVKEGARHLRRAPL
jgi:hypothetical protein